MEKQSLGDAKNAEKSSEKVPIKYVDIVIDDDYMKSNLMTNGGLRMKGGYANWDGEVVLVRYSISSELSLEYHQIAIEKIEKNNANQENLYQHEAHHIKNRENAMAPHESSINLREFLVFRVLDELSAFTTGELYNQDLTVDNILKALEKSKQKILDSYYGSVFIGEANWFLSHHSDKTNIFSREIRPDKYHQIMRQYFNIGEQDIIVVLQESGKIPIFTDIVNGLITELDNILDLLKTKNNN